MAYIDPGSGGLILQALGGLLIGWVATMGRVRRFLLRIFRRGASDE